MLSPGSLETLRLRYSRGRIPSQAAVLAALQVLDALAVLHARTPPLLHGDIRPATIVVSPGGAVQLVNPGVGTPPFAAPEQGRADPRSDLYALGATLYLLLTGELIPPAGERARADALVPPAQVVAGLAPELSASVLLLLRTNPDERPASAAEARQMLAQLLPPQVCQNVVDREVCGKSNRPAARRCARCGAALPMAEPGVLLAAALADPPGDADAVPIAPVMPAPSSADETMLPRQAVAPTAPAQPRDAAVQGAPPAQPVATDNRAVPPTMPVAVPRNGNADVTAPTLRAPTDRMVPPQRPITPAAPRRKTPSALVLGIAAGIGVLLLVCAATSWAALRLLAGPQGEPTSDPATAQVQTAVALANTPGLRATSDAATAAARTAEAEPTARPTRRPSATPAPTTVPTTEATPDPPTPEPPTPVPPTPAPLRLQAEPGTLLWDSFPATEAQYPPRGRRNGQGETFDRGPTTKRIWLGGRDSFDGDLVFAELESDVLQLTLKPAGDNAGSRVLYDQTEVGRLGNDYIVQLDISFRTQTPAASVGIAFDLQDDTNGVLFEVWNDQHWQLTTFQNGAQVIERSTDRIPSTAIVSGDGVTNLRVVRTPTVVQLWIGTTNVGSVPAGPFDGGFAGVAVSSTPALTNSATIWVDNFRVRAR